MKTENITRALNVATELSVCLRAAYSDAITEKNAFAEMVMYSIIVHMTDLERKLERVVEAANAGGAL